MTASDFSVILTQGAGQVGDSLPGGLLWAAGVVAVIAAVNVPWRLLLWWHYGRCERRMPLQPLPPAVPCPCCTAAPYKVNDCTCREDCGAYWRQAAEIGDDVVEMFGRPRTPPPPSDSVGEVIGQWEAEYRRQRGDGRD